MPGTKHTHSARLEQIRLELARQNLTLAEFAPQLIPDTSERAAGALRTSTHLDMRRA